MEVTVEGIGPIRDALGCCAVNRKPVLMPGFAVLIRITRHRLGDAIGPQPVDNGLNGKGGNIFSRRRPGREGLHSTDQSALLTAFDAYAACRRERQLYVQGPKCCDTHQRQPPGERHNPASSAEAPPNGRMAHSGTSRQRCSWDGLAKSFTRDFGCVVRTETPSGLFRLLATSSRQLQLQVELQPAFPDSCRRGKASKK
ncbi:MAG: hypothetical protein ACI8W8_002815 [Rhodothermales bacterium]|jgi:hypothetical protein